jgi:hypothetical protein
MSFSALASATEFLARCDGAAIRLHAARSLGSPRKFGTISALREGAERDMFARDVRELFLLPYAQALRNGRLRGEASGILGPVLSSNASVALDALIARGCLRPSEAVNVVLDDMLTRAHPRGFFYEPYQAEEAYSARSREEEICFVVITAFCVRYLIAFGRGRDSRIAKAVAWLCKMQDQDGAWRPSRTRLCRNETEGYQLTRAVAQAFAELPAPALKRYVPPRRRLAAAWADRVLVRCEDPDAVLTDLNIAEDPQGPSHAGRGPDIPTALHDRILYFPLEDLWLALAVGASPKHPHLAPWIQWLEESQLADGSWRLGDPSLRERLLLSDPNGRLRAEALFLTDEWITLRGAQILRIARKRTRVPSAEPVAA